MALWLKYPNPFSKHVLAGDVISRSIDSVGRLCTTRVILKTSSIPAWISHWIKSNEAFVVEESVVDPRTGTMVTITKNLNHQKMMTVEEVQTYTRSPDNRSWTLIETQARFNCNFGWLGLAGRLENLGAKKFKDHLQRSKEALLYVLERICKSDRAS